MAARLKKCCKRETPRIGGFAGILLLCPDDLFIFLYHHGVHPANNIAQQSGPVPVMWRSIR